MTNHTTTLTCRGLLFPLTLTAALLCLGSAAAQNFFLITNLVSFNGTNGQQPSGPLLQARDGNFYGTTLYGGTNGLSAGTIFRMAPSGAFTNILYFNVTNGEDPGSGLIQGADGNFYGTTAYGGAYTNSVSNAYGFGTIFKVTSNGVLTTLASLDGNSGKNPNALLEVAPGTFYGTANSGGAYSNFAGFGFGTLFKADTNNLLTNFLSFDDSNGSSPSSGLTMTTNGTLYGTTSSGGSYEYGTVFKLAADGSIASQFIFDLTNGAVPSALFPGRDGNLYGATLFGGSNRFGTLFQLTTNLVHTTLVAFDGTNGNAPTTLIQAGDGNFYGLTSQGGAHGFGNIFELATNGVLRSLYDFTGGSDGFAASSLTQGQDGNFYGTTSFGGDTGRGNIFKLSVFPLPNIQSVTRTGNNITFNWAAVSNFTYEVQFTTNLASTNWTLLRSVTPTNAVGTASDTIGPDTSRFYRIHLPHE